MSKDMHFETKDMTVLNSLVVSAPAKVILHGEHAVVYGKIAVAASLNLRTLLTWNKSTEHNVELHLTDLGFHSSWILTQLDNLPNLSSQKDDVKNIEPVDDDSIAVFKSFLYENEPEVSDISLSAALTFLILYKVICGKMGSLIPGTFVVKSEVPVGAGLGSSASYSVTVATSLLLITGAVSPESVAINSSSHSTDIESSIRSDTLKLINQWAFVGERLMHGNPSGIDNTISTYGGFLQFQCGKMQNLQRVPELDILLVNTTVPRSTKVMVGGLRERYNEMPNVYEPLFSAMGAIATECIQVLGQINEDKSDEITTSGTNEKDAHYQKLEKLIGLNQELLKIVGVSHPVVDKVCEKTLEYGLHSKLTGAGGGGCVVTLINKGVTPDMMTKLCEELKKIGCMSWLTKLGGNGVLLHRWT